VAPITHAAGVIIIIYAAVGGTTVVLPQFDPVATLKAIETYRVTHLFLPPTAYYGVLDEVAKTEYDTSSLRQLMISAAPVSPDKLRDGVRLLGPVLCQSFGQAESPLLVAWLSPRVLAEAVEGMHPERLGSCGQVTSATLVAILDENGIEMPANERGEICCRGPLVTPGYYRKPQDTEDMRRFGWHHTGDVGSLDEYGYLYIVDRLKDMIITGGFNVYSAEVEQALMQHDAVRDCAVIGLPDEKWGERVEAVVELKPGATVDTAELIAFTKQRIGSVKAPKRIELWSELPRSKVGKVLKTEVRADLLSRP
jgi:acyl-CoA synthetase (AMP-forming)/AMP-acid ligase II